MTGLVADFLPALRDPAAPVPRGLQDGSGRPAGRRFNVYRNNVLVSLIEALEVGFPAIRSLLGDENFRNIARGYAQTHPPKGPLMMRYGQGFPDYLAGLRALAPLPYLADVARLELALRASYHAADHIGLTGDDLAKIPPENLENTRLYLAPSVQTLRSAHPIADIHRFALNPTSPKPRPGAQDIAVLRPEFDPSPHILPPGGHAFLTALTAGQPFGNAAEIATAAAPEFDLAAMLGLLLAQNALMKKGPRT